MLVEKSSVLVEKLFDLGPLSSSIHLVNPSNGLVRTRELAAEKDGRSSHRSGVIHNPVEQRRERRHRPLVYGTGVEMEV